MDDNRTLLMLVLKQHYRNNPVVLDDALQVIKDYSNKGSKEEEYDKILHQLQNMMNDLPANILLYFLTMVPVPKQLPIMKSELLGTVTNSQNSISNNIRPLLIEYLNMKIPPLIAIEKKNESVTKLSEPQQEGTESENEDKQKTMSSPENKIKDPDFLKPPRFARTKTKKQLLKMKTTCQNLLDVCAEYVIKNQAELQKYYKNLKHMAWKIVYENYCDGDELNQCYEVLRDVNKKEKWLRAADNEDFTHEILADEYGSSDIFMSETYMDNNKKDPFLITASLKDAITFYIKNC